MDIFQKLRDPSRPPLVMGVVNLSPDSFYSPSRSYNGTQALDHALRMMDEGADILDLGAESTRPGSQSISEEEEIDRLTPVVESLAGKYPIPVSIDTYKPSVAERMLDLGVSLINDVTGLRDAKMTAIISRHQAGVIIMHMRGTPATMQDHIHYENCLSEVRFFLESAVQQAEGEGIDPERILIDPGIGFGKKIEHNLELIAKLDQLKGLDKPIVLGVSRKSFIGKVLDLPEEERLEGSLAAGLMGIVRGARVLRVHDVKETVRVVRLAHEILKA